MELDIFNPSRQIRGAILFWMSMLLAIMCLIAAAINIATSYYVLAFFELSFSTLSLYIAFRGYKNQVSLALSNSYSYAVVGIIYLSSSIQSIENGIFMWSFLYPVLFYLILGRRNGFLATAVGFLSQISLFMQKPTDAYALNDVVFNLNFILAYLSVWLACHILEVKRKTSEASLGQLASRDALTGVYNRHALIHNFERYRNESVKLPLSLLILDLDYFKQVNDDHGHDIGDKVLIQTAALIDALSDEHLVYRIGGEEFCIALHNANVAQATRKAEQIRSAIEKFSFNDSTTPISLTTSIGVYQCDHYKDLESVLRKADKELYKAKKNGRNQIMVCNQTAVNPT